MRYEGMSRSFKKTPVAKCAGYGAYGKKLANRKVRHAPDTVTANGKSYRKMYETWDINDCVTRWTREEAEKCGMTEVWEKIYHRK